MIKKITYLLVAAILIVFTESARNRFLNPSLIVIVYSASPKTLRLFLTYILLPLKLCFVENSFIFSCLYDFYFVNLYHDRF